MTIKKHRIALLMDEEEFQKFKDEAKSRGISVCGYLRQSGYSQLTKRETIQNKENDNPNK